MPLLTSQWLSVFFIVRSLLFPIPPSTPSWVSLIFLSNSFRLICHERQAWPGQLSQTDGHSIYPLLLACRNYVSLMLEV